MRTTCSAVWFWLCMTTASREAAQAVARCRGCSDSRRNRVFLIDLVPCPVKALGSRARSRARRDAAPETVADAARLSPRGIVVCHAPSFDVLRDPLRDAGLPLLHDAPIPFPLGNMRDRFVADVRAARGRAV